MRIVVMDNVVLNREQIGLLNTLGELIIFRDNPSTRKEVIDRAGNADILISGWTKYPRDILEDLPNLQMISLWSTGMDCIDLNTAERAGIIVTNVPGFARNAVAELTFGLILAVMRKIHPACCQIRKSRAFDWELFQGRELSGKTLGILGTGAIGVKTAQIAKGFDMNIVAFDMYPKKQLETDQILKYVDFKYVFSCSDIVSVHMPLTDGTRGIIGYPELSSMPSHGIFINTARAEIVDQEALTRCLREGVLLGCGLDDVDLDHPSWEELSRMEQVIMTPHMGFYTHEAVKTKGDICIDNVVRFISNNNDYCLKMSV